MKIVIFDTETTGLLQPINAPLDTQPKIIEFYGVALDEEFNIIDEVDELIYPEEPITKEITRITGIDDSMLKDKPVFGAIAPKINNLFEAADLGIAHNIAFDNGMIDNEFKRIGIDRVLPKHELCTVNLTKPIYGFRMSLLRLHQELTKTAFKSHRAKADVFALVRVVHNLYEKGVINFAIYKD